MICKYCNIETALSGLIHFNKHVKWCDSNPKKKDALDSLRVNRPAGNSSENQFTKAKRLGLPKPEITQETREKIRRSGLGRTHSNEMREHLSEVRKKWLLENPSLHPWKKNSKFKSVPCEVLKTHLRESGLQFEEEYTPLQDRSFSVDIAFPEARLAVEVNGEQHYNRDGTLRTYYRERHELIEKSGWRVIELHYARCYEPHLAETLKIIRERI
jgi:very-short-patch-repair endonuclease